MILITVCYANANTQVEIPLSVEKNCTVALAIARSKILKTYKEIRLENNAVGIFGQCVKLSSAVHAGDRIEIYRPLMIDPKEARRLRALG